MIKLNPNERLLVESWVNRYQVLGPGVVLLMPWQREMVRFYIGPNAATIQCQDVPTLGDVPVNVTTKVFYQVSPELFSGGMLSRVPQLNDGGWSEIVRWRTEAMIRRVLANHEWHSLKTEQVQENLEQLVKEKLAERVQGVGLSITGVTVVKVELSPDLMQTITQSEQNVVEATGRARVLKIYLEIFGEDLSRVMPYIKDWELLGLLHKNKNLQPLLMTAGFSSSPGENNGPQAQPIVQVTTNGSHHPREEGGSDSGKPKNGRSYNGFKTGPFSN